MFGSLGCTSNGKQWEYTRDFFSHIELKKQNLQNIISTIIYMAGCYRLWFCRKVLFHWFPVRFFGPHVKVRTNFLLWLEMF
jgi:hypothetical protein